MHHPKLDRGRDGSEAEEQDERRNLGQGVDAFGVGVRRGPRSELRRQSSFKRVAQLGNIEWRVQPEGNAWHLYRARRGFCEVEPED